MTDTLRILDRPALASLLRVDEDVVARLVAETDIPRVRIGGATRFVTDRVIAWLAAQEGELLAPLPEQPPARRDEGRREHLEPVGPGETPFVPDEALDALAPDAQTDSGRNLDRLKLRDALLELNDELLPMLNRLSHGRLHFPHDEKERTTPWRVDQHPDGRIATISMTWGEGTRSAPQFADQSRIEVELAHNELAVALHLAKPLASDGLEAALERAREEGFATDKDDGTPGTVAKVYPLTRPTASLAAIARTLTQDLRVLVPIWLAATESAG